mgnify:CR=1 FL=1
MILLNQTKTFQLPGVFRAGGQKIDARFVDGAVTQNVRQFYNVMGNTIEGGGKEMTQIVREYLRRLHPGFCTEFFHFGHKKSPSLVK